MQDNKYDVTGDKNNNRIPKFIWRKGSDSTRGWCSFAGKNDCLL